MIIKSVRSVINEPNMKNNSQQLVEDCKSHF